MRLAHAKQVAMVNPNLQLINHMNDTLKELLSAALFVIFVLYVWGGLLLLILRFHQLETKSSMENFLRVNHKFFASCANQELQRSLTRETMRKTKTWGWVFIGLPFCLICGSNWNCYYILCSALILFFGGRFLAYGWYGMHCIKMLEKRTD